MSKPAEILFVVPGLFQPLPMWQRDFAFQPQADNLLRLCAKTQIDNLPVTGFEQTLFHLFAHEVEADIPFAYYRYQHDFGEVPTQPLMCADPVFMQGGIDQVILQPDLPQLSDIETQSLLTILNAHLLEDGLQLVARHPQSWYLLEQGGGQALPERTTPLSQALGQSVFPLLPQGNHTYWHRLLNELQMLLHTSEVDGVNALWLWGATDAINVSKPPANQWEKVTAATSEAATIALVAQAEYQQVDNFQGLDTTTNTLVILDDLLRPAVSDNMQAWQQHMEYLEADWFTPALAASKSKQCQIGITACDGRILYCQPGASWKFWQSASARWEHLLVD